MEDNTQSNKDKVYRKAEDKIPRDKGRYRMNRFITKGCLLSLFLIGFVVLILLISGYFLFFHHSQGQSDGSNKESHNSVEMQKEQSDTNEKHEDSKRHNEQFIKGMRLAAKEEYADAIEIFKDINFNQLETKDQDIVIDTYIRNENYDKAIQLRDNADQKVIDSLFDQNREDKINNLESSTPLIHLEQAILNDDQKEVAKVADDNNIQMNKRRASAVAEAYYNIDEKDKATQFASSMLDEGINLFENEKQTKVKKETKIKENNTLSSGVTFLVWAVSITLLILILGITFLIVFRKRLPYRIVPVEAIERYNRNVVASISEAEADRYASSIQTSAVYDDTDDTDDTMDYVNIDPFNNQSDTESSNRDTAYDKKEEINTDEGVYAQSMDLATGQLENELNESNSEDDDSHFTEQADRGNSEDTSLITDSDDKSHGKKDKLLNSVKGKMNSWKSKVTSMKNRDTQNDYQDENSKYSYDFDDEDI